METPFDKALAFVLHFEGGESSDPDDAAAAQVEQGEVHTKYGITQETYNRHRYEAGEPRQPVAKIKKDEAAQIYLTDYWHKNHLDAVACYAPLLAMCLFDGAVQHGRNVMLWQQTVGADSDNVLGPQTLGQTETRVKVAGEARVMAAYLARRATYYQQQIKLNPKNQKFMKGWRRRVNELCRTVGVDPVWPV